MNQCDINYRQSSNKRLLVELTLIEVAQITQPDDGVGSGRQPKRLKTLFKHLIPSPQPKNAAPQVAAAEPVETKKTSQTNATSTTSSTSKTSPASPVNPARPKLKSSVSFSWNNLRKSSEQRKMHIIPGTLDANDPNVKQQEEDQTFDQQDLELQWMSMCNRMPQKLSGIATRMKNMNPLIKEFPIIEVIVDNQLVLEQMEGIKGSITNTLKLYLHNKSISLNLRVAEQKERVKILSRSEQYELMEKENPSIAKLREFLSLELA